MVIAYVRFSDNGPEALVKAHTVAPSKVFAGRVELTGVEGLTETQCPNFKVQKLVILEERLVTIMEGFEETQKHTTESVKIKSSQLETEAIQTDTQPTPKPKRRGRPRKNKGNENGEK